MTTAALNDAHRSVKEGAFGPALSSLLEGFRAVAHPRIAELVGKVSALAEQTRPAIAGKNLEARKALAIELAKRQITVNCVAPGLIATDMVDEQVPMEEILKAIPMQRVGTAEEVASVVSFLLSPDASYVTGASLIVDGGAVLQVLTPAG